MAARQAPQLRLFRNDFAARGASLAIRLAGTASNRDAIGARVTRRDRPAARTRIVQAGSGFLSQHSKELLFGLGASERDREADGRVAVRRSAGVHRRAAERRAAARRGRPTRAEPFAAATASPPTHRPRRAAERRPPPDATWLYEPFPAPDFSLTDVGGQTRSLAALAGRPALLLFWSAADAGVPRGARRARARPRRAGRAGVGALAIALDAPAKMPRASARAAPARVPVVAASPRSA